MFYVNFNKTTGAIVSYQEGPDSSENLCPDDCDTLVFDAVFPGMWGSNGMVVMKVDVETKELVFINPVLVPKAINT